MTDAARARGGRERAAGGDYGGVGPGKRFRARRPPGVGATGTAAQGRNTDVAGTTRMQTQAQAQAQAQAKAQPSKTIDLAVPANCELTRKAGGKLEFRFPERSGFLTAARWEFRDKKELVDYLARLLSLEVKGEGLRGTAVCSIRVKSPCPSAAWATCRSRSDAESGARSIVRSPPAR